MGSTVSSSATLLPRVSWAFLAAATAVGLAPWFTVSRRLLGITTTWNQPSTYFGVAVVLAGAAVGLVFAGPEQRWRGGAIGVGVTVGALALGSLGVSFLATVARL